MATDPNRWTLKTHEAVSAAITAAREASNPEVTPDHLLRALLEQPEGVVLPLVTRLGLAPLTLRNRADEALDALPRSYGGSDPEISRGLRRVLEDADQTRVELGDEYLSTEHLIVAMARSGRRDETAWLDVDRSDVLDALREVRGSHRVTSKPISSIIL